MMDTEFIHLENQTRDADSSQLLNLKSDSGTLIGT